HLCLSNYPRTKYGGAQRAATAAGARRIAPRGRLQRVRRNYQTRSAKEIWLDNRRRIPASSRQTRLAAALRYRDAMSAIGTKQTWAVPLQMSAFDPKRTSRMTSVQR